MAEQTVNAVTSPDLAQSLIDQALAEPEQENVEVTVVPPSDTLVTLPGGFVTPDGEVIKTVEVRELNGLDEEAISKASTIGRVLNTVLSRGTVKIGNLPVNEETLDLMLAGDRDAVLLGIFKATFGNPAELQSFCNGCSEMKTVSVDLEADIKSRVLVDPINDRYFTVQGTKHEYKVTLPKGRLQRDMNNSTSNKTIAELTSDLLGGTVLEIDGNPVYHKTVVQKIGLTDRRKITEELTERNPGPRFEPITVTCPDCESEVVVPISLGGLFRF